MEVWTYHFAWVPCPKSQVRHGCVHGNKLFEGESRNSCRRKSSAKLSTQVPHTFLHKLTQYPIIMIITHNVLLPCSSKIKTFDRDPMNMKRPPSYKMFVNHSTTLYATFWGYGSCTNFNNGRGSPDSSLH